MRPILAVLVTQMLALGVFAQTAEFGHASGGTIDAITKAPRQTAGSLSLSRGTGGTGYEGSVGGEAIKDRLWFFAAASVLPQMQFTPSRQQVDWKNAATTFHPMQSQQRDFSSFLTLRATSVLSDKTTFDFSFSKRDAQ